MGTPLQDQASAVLNAMDEATVQTVITLYDNGKLPTHPNIPRKLAIRCVLENEDYGIKMSSFDVDYWLHWFNIK